MSLTKKIHRARTATLAALLLAAPAGVFSDCCDDEPCCTNFGTFYTGLGIEFGTIYEKTTTSADRFVPPNPVAVSTSNVTFKGLGNWKPYGTFNLGYQTPSLCNCYLALEASISSAPKTFNETNTQVTETLMTWKSNDFELTSIFAVTLKPGYQIYPDVSIFGSFGYCRARGQYRSSGLGVGGVDSSGNSEILNTFSANPHKYLHGHEAGMGFSIRTSDHISLNLAYLKSSYNSIAWSRTSTDPTTGQFLIRNQKAKPETEHCAVTVSYAFNPSDCYCSAAPACSGHEIYVGIVADRDISSLFQTMHQRLSNDPILNRPDPNANILFGFTDAVSRGWGFEAFGGYGYTFCSKVYIGVEGFYNHTPSSFKAFFLSTTPVNVTTSIAGSTASGINLFKLKDSYGISFLPGYKLNEHLLLYLKLGFSTRRLHFLKTFNTVPAPTARDFAANNNNYTKNCHGYLLGGGFDLKLCNNLYLRNEYDVTFYSKVKIPSVAFVGIGAGGLFNSIDFNFKVISSQYKLGLVYKFPFN